MRQRDDQGMSLLELLVTMLITPLLVGAVSLGLLQAFTTQSSVASTLNRTSNATIDQNTLASDIHSAAAISGAGISFKNADGSTSLSVGLAGGDTGYCGSAGIQFLTITESNGDTVGYLSVQDPASGTYSLVRTYCVAAENTSTPDQQTTLMTGLTVDPASQLTLACAPDNTAAACTQVATTNQNSAGKIVPWIAAAYVTSVSAPVDGPNDVVGTVTSASVLTVALQNYTPSSINQPSSTSATTTTTLGATGNGTGVQLGGVTPVTPAPPTASISPLMLLGPSYPAVMGTAGTTCTTPLMTLAGGSILDVAAGAGDIAVNAACNNAVVLQTGAAPRVHGIRGPGHGKNGGPAVQGATATMNANAVDQSIVDPLATGNSNAVVAPTMPTGLVTATAASCSLSGTIFTLSPGFYLNGVYGLGSTSKSAPCGAYTQPRSPSYNFLPGTYQFGASNANGAGLFNAEGSVTVTFQSTVGTSTEVYFADGFEAGQSAKVTFGNGVYLLDNISNANGTCSVQPGPALLGGKPRPGFLGLLASCNPGPCVPTLRAPGPTGAPAGSQGSFSVFGSASIATTGGGALFYVMKNNGGFNIATNGTVYLQGLGTWNGQNYQGLSLWDPNASATSQVLLGSTSKAKSFVMGGVYVPNQQLVLGQQGVLTAKYMVLQSLSILGYGTLNIG